MHLDECTIKEIVVEPLLASNFEESIKCALLSAIENDLNVTVMRQGKAYRIVPREIMRDIFAQQREEGDSL
jgi:hypothetical protein